MVHDEELVDLLRYLQVRLDPERADSGRVNLDEVEANCDGASTLTR